MAPVPAGLQRSTHPARRIRAQDRPSPRVLATQPTLVLRRPAPAPILHSVHPRQRVRQAARALRIAPRGPTVHRGPASRSWLTAAPALAMVSARTGTVSLDSVAPLPVAPATRARPAPASRRTTVRTVAAVNSATRGPAELVLTVAPAIRTTIHARPAKCPAPREPLSARTPST